MAERATSDRVAADMRPADYRKAVQRLRGIAAKKTKIASLNGEISGIFDAVEGFKVNKVAARIFLSLDGKEEDRVDIVRSLMGLIDASGWSTGDLVDQAEGSSNVISAQFRRAAGQQQEGDDGEEEEEQEIDDEVADAAAAEPAAKQPPAEEPTAGKALSPAEARRRVKEHFAAGNAPPAAGNAGETYTGDNSDLAGDD